MGLVRQPRHLRRPLWRGSRLPHWTYCCWLREGAGHRSGTQHRAPQRRGLLMGAPVLAADAAEVLPGWACLEISGSTLRLFGYVTETTIGGIPFLALLAPDSNGGLEARRL